MVSDDPQELAPLPWKRDEVLERVGADPSWIEDGNGRLVLRVYRDTTEGNRLIAERIVMSVNAHDALIAALRTWGKCRRCNGPGLEGDAIIAGTVFVRDAYTKILTRSSGKCRDCEGHGYPADVWALLPEGKAK